MSLHSANPALRPAVPPPVAPSPGSPHHARVLIVDDELSIRRTLAEFLRTAGYHVVEAEQAEAALHHLRAGPFDVVVSDIILPRVTGMELLRRIQAIAPQVQVVMMTGEPTLETATESLRAGAADYLFKPISKTDILRTVAHCARIKKLEDTRRRLEAENQLHREQLERLVAERTAQLRASELRAQNFARLNQDTLDTLAEQLCVLATDGTILAVNQPWRTFARTLQPPTGPAEVGADYFALCAAVLGAEPAVTDRALAGLRAVARGDQPEFMLEYAGQPQHPDRWYAFRAKRFSSGQPVRIVVAHEDITERKRAATELQHQHDLYRRAIMAANAIPYQKDYLQDRYVFMGEGIKDLLGYTPEELTASVWRTIILESVVTGDAAGLTMAEAGQRAVAGQLKNWRADYRVLTRSGEVRWIADSSISLLDASGRYTGSLGIIQDITDRRRAEDQLRKLARAVEQSPTAILITDRKGDIEFVNPKFTEITGYSAEEVRGRNPRLLQSGETPPGEYQRLWEAIAAGREWRGELHNKRKDGALYWERLSISPVRNGSGEITHFVAMKEDVTEQKLTQAKLLRAQRVESIGSLASGIAHDLNNILTPIIMCAPMLSAEDSPETRRELAATIDSSAHRAVGVVKQLLSFARGKEGTKLPVQFRHLVRDMAKIARETFPRSIQIEDACAANLWPVLADATQLHQVILNLCVNARDAMPEGGRLRLRASNVTLDDHYVAMHPEAAPGPYVRLQVEDTGAGIPEDIQEHIFESFFTTKGADHGTGLGLTTVQGIVKDHKGFITLASTPGKGTTFDVYLPAAPESKAIAATVAPSASTTRGQGQLILVVDDEAAVCEVTRRTLEHHGYAVLAADNGISGLARFSERQHEIRAVVTDAMMPLMDGVTFCRALRALSPNTPLIVSSGGLFGKAGTIALRAFEEMGVPYILHKPHNAEVLLRTLAAVLQPAPPAATKP